MTLITLFSSDFNHAVFKHTLRQNKLRSRLDFTVKKRHFKVCIF